MFSHILCAVDGSDLSLKAAQLASELAARDGAKLTFLTVTKPLKMTDELKRYIEVENRVGDPQYVLDEYTEQVVEDAKAAARAAGVSGPKSEVRTGQPARSIVDYAARNSCDAIVLGSRGHGDLEGTLLGSVSHKVTSLAKCTVITVK